jgi:predicted Zn-dependent protease
MSLFAKIDSAVDRLATLLVQPPHQRAAKLSLYAVFIAAAVWAPYSLAQHVYTSGFYLVSVKREAKTGREAAVQLEKEFHLKPHNDPVTLYVNKIGTRITRENNPWQAEFSFNVVEDKSMINAFALPGGKIYITTGLLDRLENEAELASVMAHEVAHVTRRHYARNMGRRMLLSWVKKFLGSTDQTIFGAGSFLTTNVTLIKMRQEDELEADYQGALYIYEVGYDTAGAVSLVKKLLTLEKQMPEGMRIMALTHPPSGERLEAMIALQDSLPIKEEIVLGEESFREVVKKPQPEAPAPPAPAPQAPAKPRL